jgi:hypothetical protein
LEGSVKNDGDFGNKILKNTLKENLWFNCQNQIKKKKSQIQRDAGDDDLGRWKLSGS